MTRKQLTELVREVMMELDEANVTGGTASFTPGAGENYATPFAFGKNKKALSVSKKIGFKKASRPKRPTSTKAFDYL